MSPGAGRAPGRGPGAWGCTETGQEGTGRPSLGSARPRPPTHPRPRASECRRRSWNPPRGLSGTAARPRAELAGSGGAGTQPRSAGKCLEGRGASESGRFPK